METKHLVLLSVLTLGLTGAITHAAIQQEDTGIYTSYIKGGANYVVSDYANGTIAYAKDKQWEKFEGLLAQGDDNSDTDIETDTNTAEEDYQPEPANALETTVNVLNTVHEGVEATDNTIRGVKMIKSGIRDLKF